MYIAYKSDIKSLYRKCVLNCIPFTIPFTDVNDNLKIN